MNSTGDATNTLELIGEAGGHAPFSAMSGAAGDRRMAAVRNGEPLVAETSGKALRLLAPIFAGQRCTTCHDRGTLLGGFTYELERVAYDAEKDAARRPRKN